VRVARGAHVPAVPEPTGPGMPKSESERPQASDGSPAPQPGPLLDARFADSVPPLSRQRTESRRSTLASPKSSSRREVETVSAPGARVIVASAAPGSPTAATTVTVTHGTTTRNIP